MKKSPNDHKHYYPLTLANGLRVLLVNNYQSNKSAAALAVNTGHFDDPEDRQGLAHFLEHMLFLGTEKYPDSGEYQKFIHQHGGSNNAWTGTEHTCYFFDVNHLYFEDALDRFSHFFISPLLSNHFIQSERINIDAEYKLKLKDDIRRLYDVHKETINPLHPFSKFSVGNTDTLADRNGQSIQQEIQAFFQENYHAKAMTLVLEAPQSIEELKALATTKFLSIPSFNALTHKHSAPKVVAPLYLPEHQSTLIDVLPVNNENQFIISFAMPSIDHLYRNKPETILAYLLGHEGKGSILSLLKEKKWALALNAGSGINGSNFKDFNISVQLTKAGALHLFDIAHIVFQYITLMKSKPIAQYYFDEKKSLANISFAYPEKLKPLDSVNQLVINMQHYPEKDYIFGDYAMDELCDTEIDSLLSYLSPNNARLIHINKNNTFELVSKWYQVPYKVSKISPGILTQWKQCNINSALFLPSTNPYLNDSPEVLIQNKPQELNQNLALIPACIEKQNGYELWFKQDKTFFVPKGYIYIGIDSPITVETKEHIAMTRLFVDLFNDSVIEDNYDAEVAGIQYNLYAHQGGVTLQLSGFSHKQVVLLNKLLATLTTITFSEAQFSLFKEKLIEHWQNANTSKSISQLFSYLSSSMQPNNPTSRQLANALSAVTYQSFIHYAEKIFNKISIKSLIHGNWNIKQAKEIDKIIFAAFKGKTGNQYQVKPAVINIKTKGMLTLPIILPKYDHATISYYPLPDKDIVSMAKTMLLSQILSPLFFHKMRTEKQYGYLVGVNFIPINRYPGIAFYIQSPKTEAIELSKAINHFIHEIHHSMNEFEEENLNQIKNGLTAQLSEKDTSLRIKSQRFWSTLCTDECNFEHKKQLISAINDLTINDVKTFINETLIADNVPDRINLLTFDHKKKVKKNGLTHNDIESTIDELHHYARKH